MNVQIVKRGMNVLLASLAGLGLKYSKTPLNVNNPFPILQNLQSDITPH